MRTVSSDDAMGTRLCVKRMSMAMVEVASAAAMVVTGSKRGFSVSEPSVSLKDYDNSIEVAVSLDRDIKIAGETAVGLWVTAVGISDERSDGYVSVALVDEDDEDIIGGSGVCNTGKSKLCSDVTFQALSKALISYTKLMQKYVGLNPDANMYIQWAIKDINESVSSIWSDTKAVAKPKRAVEDLLERVKQGGNAPKATRNVPSRGRGAAEEGDGEGYLITAKVMSDPMHVKEYLLSPAVRVSGVHSGETKSQYILEDKPTIVVAKVNVEDAFQRGQVRLFNAKKSEMGAISTKPMDPQSIVCSLKIYNGTANTFVAVDGECNAQDYGRVYSFQEMLQGIELRLRRLGHRLGFMDSDIRVTPRFNGTIAAGWEILAKFGTGHGGGVRGVQLRFRPGPVTASDPQYLVPYSNNMTLSLIPDMGYATKFNCDQIVFNPDLAYMRVRYQVNHGEQQNHAGLKVLSKMCDVMALQGKKYI